LELDANKSGREMSEDRLREEMAAWQQEISIIW